MTINILISIIAIIIIGGGLLIYNLIKKIETQQAILYSYMSYLNKFSDIIELSDKKLKEIDARGHFKADDEIGWFFEQVMFMQETLNSFNIKNL